MDLVRKLIRDIPDFPKPGILFKDITPVLANPAAFRAVIDALAAHVGPQRPTHLAGIESRGFIFGAPLATQLGVGFVPIRKRGKLPYDTRRVEYALEYGTDVLEMHVDALVAGDRVVVVDDLLATGGTAGAAARLLSDAGATVLGASFVIELGFLGGRKNLPGVAVHSLIQY